MEEAGGRESCPLLWVQWAVTSQTKAEGVRALIPDQVSLVYLLVTKKTVSGCRELGGKGQTFPHLAGLRPA